MARTRKIRAALEFAGSFEGIGPFKRRHRYQGSEACSWSNEITEMLRVPRRLFARTIALDQAQEGHLVDALALRGDEGRSTLR